MKINDTYLIQPRPKAGRTAMPKHEKHRTRLASGADTPPPTSKRPTRQQQNPGWTQVAVRSSRGHHTAATFSDSISTPEHCANDGRHPAFFPLAMAGSPCSPDRPHTGPCGESRGGY